MTGLHLLITILLFSFNVHCCIFHYIFSKLLNYKLMGVFVSILCVYVYAILCSNLVSAILDVVLLLSRSGGNCRTLGEQ